MSERFAGRYALIKSLGRGGMGEVFVARDLTTGTECALKRLHTGGTMSASEVMRREFEALTRVRHPAIVSVLELGFAPDGTPYFTMEYVPGVPPERAIARGDWPGFFFLASQVAQGLEALHAAGVVHGDLKPSNLLVVPGAAPGDLPLGVRILDFGLAAVLGREDRGHQGTPGYAAPEVVRGEIPNEASDLYGLGATLYTLIARQPPFQSDEPTAMLRRQQDGPPSSAQLEDAGAPAALVQLVQRLLAPEPGERPRGLREVRRELARMHVAARRPLAERLRCANVVGRERELARLESWLTDSPKRVHAMLISGEAGSGKSALLAELAARAALGGRSVARFACSAFEAPAAAGLALVRRLTTEAEGQGSESLVASRALLADPDARLDERSLNAVVLELAAAAHARVGSWRPPLVLLDDIERLDPLSRRLLVRLSLHAEPASLVWIGAEGCTAADRSEAMQALLEAGVAQTLELAPLDREGVSRLASARLNEAAPESLVSFLWDRARGHAGLTVELLRLAAEGGALRESEGGVVVEVSALEAVAMPDSLEASHLERLGAMSEAARAAALVLAVWGRPLEPERARTLEPKADAAGFESLIESGLARPDSRGWLALSTPSLAERVLQTYGDPRRRAIHRAAAAEPDISPSERFRHLRDAGDAGAALAAAEQALARTHDERLPAAAAALADAAAPELAGGFHELAGRELSARGRYGDAIPHLERAVSLAARGEETAVRGLLLSTAYLRMGRNDDVARAVAAALAAEPSPGLRSRLLSNESARLQTSVSNEGARAAAEQALRLAETADDRQAVGIAANTLAHILLALGEHAEAERVATQAATAFRAAADRLGEARALGTRAAVAHARQDVATADRLYRHALEGARQLGNRLVTEELLSAHAFLLLETGKWERARSAHAESLRIALEDGRARGAALAIANLAQDDALTGRPRQSRRQARAAIRLTRAYLPRLEPFAWRALCQAYRIAGRLGRADRAGRRALSQSMESALAYQVDWARVELGRVWAQAGRWDQARSLWERALAETSERGSVARTLMLALTGRAALRLDDQSAAEARLGEAERWLAAHPSPYAAAVTDQLGAELALVQGRAADAADRGRRALVALGELPAPADRAHAALEFARLARASRGESRLPVGEWLDLATAGFERFGDRRSRERALSATIEWLRRAGAQASTVKSDRSLIESVSRLLDSILDLKELTHRAMDLAVEQFGAERGVLLLFDLETGILTPIAERGAIDAATRQHAVGYSRRVVDRVTTSGGSLLIADAPSDPRAASESVLDLRLRSIVCVPMYAGGRVLGAVYMDDTRRRDAFTDADRGLLEGFAHLMAVAIQNSRGHEEVRRANERLVDENLALRQEVGARFQVENVIGTASGMQRVMALIGRAARVNSTVLITGENGTGKELLARTLHHGSKRHLGPFVAVNCGAIPEGLLESELFGILPNVATDVRARDGRFVQADGGTLFLDEIGEMPLKQQVALLSALANREITPVGGGKPVTVDVRIIAATNSDLRRQIEEGTFREDLYYRLSVIEIEVPPLRERKADIPALAKHFVSHFAKLQEREIPEITPEFLAALMQNDWGGNVRELQNYIERVMAMTAGNRLVPDPLPRGLEGRATALRLGRGRGLVHVVEELERKLVIEALDRAHGNQSVAARELGITEQTIRYRIRKYGLPAARSNARYRKHRR